MGEIILSFGRFSDFWIQLVAGRGVVEGGLVRFWGGVIVLGRTGVQTGGQRGIFSVVLESLVLVRGVGGQEG